MGAPRNPHVGPVRCGVDYDHSAHTWSDGPDEQHHCDGGVDEHCPACGQLVDPDGEFLNAPVIWEGGLVHGHAGCLADVLHGRRAS